MDFADKLAQAVRRTGNPVVVGLDPRWESLPELLRTDVESADRSGRAARFEAFCRGVIDVVAPLVPAVKPQAAFFEQLGPPGMAALANVVAHARAQDLLVIADGKRNDIGTTAEAYADGWLGADSPWGGDALTISPYLGDDSLQPFVDVARSRQAGLFVLVKTSNPGGGQFQDRLVEGRPLYRLVAEHVESLAAATQGSCGYGLVGAVVGATYPEQLVELRTAMPHAWFLVPGYGSQGGTASDVAGAFDQHGLGAVVNNSRGIIFAHARKEFAGQFAPTQWQRAVEAATRQMIDELRSHTSVGRLTSAS